MNAQILITKSSNKTKDFARKFAKSLKGGEALLLFGNLGNGKTTFVQGLAEGLGIKERIISPTFIIVRQHTLNQKLNLKDQTFYHIDLYRVQDSKDIEALGLEEIFSDPHNIVAIEWAEKLQKLPEKRTEIYFEYVSDNERRITIKQLT